MAVIERITRTVFNPCKGLVIKHQVSFGSKDASQKRKSELYTYSYKSQAYSDITELTSLNLNTSDFVFLERLNKDREVENEKIYISYPHLFKIKRALKDAIKWFYDDKYENLFLIKNNELIYNSDFSDERIEIYGLIGNKGIILEPDVVEIETQQYEGITMYINSEADYVHMTIDQVEALYDFFMTFNLYNASQLLINYVTSINPDNVSSSGFSNSRKGSSTGGKLPLKKKTKSKKKSEDDSK
jgi:hypothetical protein